MASNNARGAVPNNEVSGSENEAHLLGDSLLNSLVGDSLSFENYEYSLGQWTDSQATCEYPAQGMCQQQVNWAANGLFVFFKIIIILNIQLFFNIA